LNHTSQFFNISFLNLIAVSYALVAAKKVYELLFV